MSVGRPVPGIFGEKPGRDVARSGRVRLPESINHSDAQMVGIRPSGASAPCRPERISSKWRRLTDIQAVFA
jgi:hypothetical protein